MTPITPCRGSDQWDDAIDGEHHTRRATRLHKARIRCRPCTAKADCLDARYSEPHLPGGVWGGRIYDRGERHPWPEMSPAPQRGEVAA